MRGMSTVALIDNFVENLSATLEKREMSQAELARQSGVHYVTINKILNFKMVPTVEMCERLTLALNITAERFFRKPA